MKNKNNLFEEIISRRIPHILGMYVAAVWLSVEIADWMSDKFSISNQFSTYVFVGMLTFIPSVVMLAWGHGRPGKDRWSKIEVSWIPVNALISLFAIYSLSSTQAITTEQNTQKYEEKTALAALSTPIESINLQKEVVTNNHQSVLNFFWQNKSDDDSLDWLSYGAPWLFSQDLKRKPVLSVLTPYDSKNVFNEILSKGFDDAVGVPLALALQIAKNNSEKWFVMGSYQYSGDRLEFTVKLYETESGKLEREITETHNNWLTALDQMSYKLDEILLEFDTGVDNIIADLAIEDHTSNNIEAIKHLIQAKNSVAFNNNFTLATEQILQAIELDESFADAHVLAADYFRAQGDFSKAIEYTEQALSFDYKLYDETEYALKANLYVMSGKRNKALLVVENWVKVFPKSTVALTSLGRHYLVLENRLDQAKEVFEKLSILEGEEQKSLVKLGKIYRVQEEKSKSIEVLEKYLEANPQKSEAYLELANAYKQFSMFEKAKEMYEQAAIIGSKDFAAEVGVANTIALLGDYKLAIKQLNDLLSNKNSDREKYNLLLAKIEILKQTGQAEQAWAIFDTVEPAAKNILSPLIYLFEMDAGKIEVLILQGKFEQALDYANNFRENTKPPFKDVSTAFFINIYLAMDDVDNFKQELNSFEQFLESFPIPYYNQRVVAWKSKVAHWDNDLNLSIQLIDQAITESKQSIWGLHNNKIIDGLMYDKANALLEQKKYTKAISTLDLILNRNPLFVQAHSMQAKIYVLQNDLSNAHKSIQKALSMWSDADADFVDLVQLKQLQESLNLN